MARADNWLKMLIYCIIKGIMSDYKPLSPQELQQGYFILSHRSIFQKILLGFFGAIILFLYIYFLVFLIRYIQAPSFTSLAQDIRENSVNWQIWHSERRPQALNISNPQYLSLGSNRYDLVAFINNPNNNWAAPSLEYIFVVNGQEIAAEQSFINPGENRLLVKTAYQSNGSITSINAKFGAIKWQRFSSNDPVVNFDITDVKFQPVTRQTEGKNSIVIPPRLTWKAQNVSLHDFWLVGWQAALFSGEKLVGVKETKSSNFDSLQSRDLEVVWLNDLPRVTKYVVYPVLNWLDEANYKRRSSDTVSGR